MPSPRVIVPMHGAAQPAATPPHLSYSNGPLLTSVEVYTIFWGAAWTEAAQSALAPQINQFFDVVLKSSLIDLLAEYSVPGKAIGHGSRVGTSTITSSEPGGGSGTVTDAQIQQALQGWISSHTVSQQPNNNTLYFVYIAPNITVTDSQGDASCTQLCGYHWYIAGTSPEIYYAVMPFPGCAGCLGPLTEIQALTSTSSHELCESITDAQPWSGWNDSSNGEIGDICAWVTGVIGGFTVQKVWSNAQNSCAIAPRVVIWESLGGAALGDVSAVSWEPGRLDLFVRGTGNVIYHKYFYGSWEPSQTGWESLGGLTTGNVSSVSWGVGRLDVFVRGTDDAIYHKYFDEAWEPSQTGWESLGGATPGDVSAVAWGSGRLDVFARGAANAIYHKYFDGAWKPSQTDWESIGGTTLGDASVVSWGSGRLDVFVRGLDNAIYHKYFNGVWHPSQTDWEYLGGAAQGDVSAVSWGSGRLDLFVRGSDSEIYHKYFDGAWHPSQTDWESLGGSALGDVSSVSWGSGRLDVFVRGAGNAVYHKYFDGAWQPSQTGWESIGGATLGDASAVSWGLGRFDVFIPGAGNVAYHKYLDGAWGPLA